MHFSAYDSQHSRLKLFRPVPNPPLQLLFPESVGSYEGEAIPEPEAYIEKPPEPDELLRTMHRLLGL